jgi:lipoate-protein ligase B
MKIIPAGRGGDITYHGPGQLVMYPVVDLQKLYKDVHLFLRCLEDVVIEILGTFNIRGERKEGFTGVWVGAKKICSIGIGVRNWVTFHGAAINVKKDDLGGFSFMRPCGLDIEMTSVEGETGLVFSVDEIKPSARSALSRIAAGKER